MAEFNPALSSDPPAPTNRGGAGSYESSETIQNIAWQTRPALPTAYESRLADALMAAFDDGAADLAGLAARLNAARVPAPDGGAWSDAALAAELARLGG